MKCNGHGDIGLRPALPVRRIGVAQIDIELADDSKWRLSTTIPHAEDGEDSRGNCLPAADDRAVAGLVRPTLLDRRKNAAAGIVAVLTQEGIDPADRMHLVNRNDRRGRTAARIECRKQDQSTCPKNALWSLLQLFCQAAERARTGAAPIL